MMGGFKDAMYGMSGRVENIQDPMGAWTECCICCFSCWICLLLKQQRVPVRISKNKLLTVASVRSYQCDLKFQVQVAVSESVECCRVAGGQDQILPLGIATVFGEWTCLSESCPGARVRPLTQRVSQVPFPKPVTCVSTFYPSLIAGGPSELRRVHV